MFAHLIFGQVSNLLQQLIVTVTCKTNRHNRDRSLMQDANAKFQENGINTTAIMTSFS